MWSFLIGKKRKEFLAAQNVYQAKRLGKRLDSSLRSINSLRDK